MKYSFHFSENKRLLIYLLICLIPCAIIEAFLHESGHVLMAWLLNVQVLEFKIQPYPFSWDNSYVLLGYPPNFPKWGIVLIMLSGGLFTLSIGLFCLILFYHRKMHPFGEIFFSFYFILLSFDFIIYNFLDVFFIQFGDWYYIYKTYPYINGIFLLIGIIFIVLLVKHFTKIANKIDIEFE